MRQVLVIVALVVTLAGCDARVSNKVTPDEYHVYSDWMRLRYSKTTPDNLYLRTHTFAFPTVSDLNFRVAMDKAGVASSLVKQLQVLGDAEYGVDFDSQQTYLRLPWNFKEVDDFRLIPLDRGQYDLIGFSRVAFNRAHDHALFAVDVICGGLCGTGEVVSARKASGGWLFENSGWSWVY
jgi:hypothetical protein